MITATFKRAFDSDEDLELYCVTTGQVPLTVKRNDTTVVKERDLIEGGYAVKELADGK